MAFSFLWISSTRRKTQVVDVIEHFPRFRISPIKPQASSVIELPIHTIYTSQTQPGDQLVICTIEEMGRRFNKVNTVPIESPIQRVGT